MKYLVATTCAIALTLGAAELAQAQTAGTIVRDHRITTRIIRDHRGPGPVRVIVRNYGSCPYGTPHCARSH